MPQIQKGRARARPLDRVSCGKSLAHSSYNAWAARKPQINVYLLPYFPVRQLSPCTDELLNELGPQCLATVKMAHMPAGFVEDCQFRVTHLREARHDRSSLRKSKSGSHDQTA
jgi:hypothetical protein